MSEVDQLKQRIKDSGLDGVETAHVRDDYEPAGQLMINDLVATGEFITRKAPMHSFEQTWRIFTTENKPY